MKKLILLALAALLILQGCSGRSKPQEISALYKSAGEITAQAEIKTISGYILEYTVAYRRSAQVAEVEILAPEALKGIRARVKNGGAEIIYEGASAETLLPYIPGYSPVDALDGIFLDLAGGVPSDWSTEKIDGGQMIALTFAGSHEAQALEKRLWLDSESLALRQAEFFIDGAMVMRLSVTALTVYAE